MMSISSQHILDNIFIYLKEKDLLDLSMSCKLLNFFVKNWKSSVPKSLGLAFNVDNAAKIGFHIFKNSIGILTCEGYDSSKLDDLAIIKAFNSKGIDAEFVIWDHPRDMRKYEAIIVRSTWGYHLKVPQFIETLHKIDTLGIPLLNPVNTLVWNSDKRYLKEVADQYSIETQWILSSELSQLGDILKQKNWTDCVIKPTVSAEGDNTYRFKIEETDSIIEKCKEAKKDSWMLQPFVKEIQDDGEWSLVVLEGKYLHGILKTPAEGNFLVHKYHGGTYCKANPPTWMVEQVEKIVSDLKRDIFYARVDVVSRPLQNVGVMEIEAIEPALFFPYSGRIDDLAETFVKAAINRLKAIPK